MVEEKHDDEKSTLSDPASTLLREEDRKVNMSEDELRREIEDELDEVADTDESLEKKKRKRNCLICPHGKRKDNCVEIMCGGCPHRRRKVRCKDCGGHGICMNYSIRYVYIFLFTRQF